MQAQVTSPLSSRPPAHASPPAGAQPRPDELHAAFGPERRLARHQYLYRAGEECRGIYLIEQGSVKVYTLSANGDEQIVRFHLPGEILALEALGESRYSSSAMALEPTRVRLLSLPALNALYARSPTLYRRILQLVGRRIAELHEHMLMLGRKTAAERLAAFLTDLALRTGSRELTLSMSRDAIGSYLGIALETVSRLLHQFAHERLICLHGRRISVVEPARLRALANAEYARAA